jgi:hypothetical protein
MDFALKPRYSLHKIRSDRQPYLLPGMLSGVQPLRMLMSHGMQVLAHGYRLMLGPRPALTG